MPQMRRADQTGKDGLRRRQRGRRTRAGGGRLRQMRGGVLHRRAGRPGPGDGRQARAPDRAAGGGASAEKGRRLAGGLAAERHGQGHEPGRRGTGEDEAHPAGHLHHQGQEVIFISGGRLLPLASNASGSLKLG